MKWLTKLFSRRVEQRDPVYRVVLFSTDNHQITQKLIYPTNYTNNISRGERTYTFAPEGGLKVYRRWDAGILRSKKGRRVVCPYARWCNKGGGDQPRQWPTSPTHPVGAHETDHRRTPLGTGQQVRRRYFGGRRCRGLSQAAQAQRQR